jgi:hypothetical protein
VKWKYIFSIFSLSLVGALCILDAHGASRESRWGDGPATRVSIVMEGAQDMDPLVWRSLDREIRRIFRPADTEMQLVTPLEGAHHPEFHTEVIVMRIAGKCQVGSLPPLQGHRPDTLGRTFVTDGVILPFVELDCRQIAGAIRERVLGFNRERRLELLGVAMARVLAHEIYHVLARTDEHSPHGIAAETMGASQLIGGPLDFRYEDFERMGLVGMIGTN